MKRIAFYATIFPIMACLVSFNSPTTLKGTWEYLGGVYNGKVDTASKEYKLYRNYTDKDFVAMVVQKGYKSEKYEAGDYTIKDDTCFEKSTFSSQPSQLVGKTIPYLFKLQNNELVFSATLPSGMVIEEHWKKIK